jgi:hypothetical protein
VAKPPANSGKPWTIADVAKLRDLAKGNTPTRVIAIKLERTPTAVNDKAAVEKISLKPTNQRPYGSKP